MATLAYTIVTFDPIRLVTEPVREVAVHLITLPSLGDTQKRLRHLSAMLPVWILIFADDCHIRRHD